MSRSKLDTLIEMHTYCRPRGSHSERQFIARYVSNLPGAWQDASRNWHVTIGTAPRVLWSCHTDTVHRASGRQRVILNDAGILALAPGERANCLGADDTAGVWLCREMVLAGIPGRYVFHFGEEAGGIGSRSLAIHEPGLLDGITAAIALDRAGTGDVITHQSGGRTASDAFADSLSAALNASGLAYQPCHGIYTDTAEYADIVAECSNLSVGYSSAHSAAETLDTGHLMALRRALFDLDPDSLIIARDPHAVDPGDWPASWDLDPVDGTTAETGPACWDSAVESAYLDQAWADIQEALRRERRYWRYQ